MTTRIYVQCDGPPRTTGTTCRAYIVTDYGKRATDHGWIWHSRLGHRCPSCVRDGR